MVVADGGGSSGGARDGGDGSCGRDVDDEFGEPSRRGRGKAPRDPVG
jgi:hypothetical protein